MARVGLGRATSRPCSRPSSASRPSAATCSPLSEFLETPARQAAVVEETGHRPWPLPDNEWVQAQTWESLLFAHWPVPLEAVRAHVPEPLNVDTFEGDAWVGITPFRVSGLRVRGLPPLPVVSSFLEINVRTYVEYEGKTGIWFFSLDAESALAVEAARRTYRLPYFRARMSADFAAEVQYSSTRTDSRGHRAGFEGTYAASGQPNPAAAGSLEHFLTERYALFTIHDGEVHWAQIHHRPWPLQEAEAEIVDNTMPPPGIELGGKPLCHYSGRQDVVIWALEPFVP